MFASLLFISFSNSKHPLKISQSQSGVVGSREMVRVELNFEFIFHTTFIEGKRARESENASEH